MVFSKTQKPAELQSNNPEEIIKFQCERLKKNYEDMQNLLEVELAEQARLAANLKRTEEKVAKIRGAMDYSELVLTGLKSDLDKVKAIGHNS